MFAKQLLFALSPSRYKAAICSRRAGKSNVIIIELFQELINNPRSSSLYLGLTEESVEKTIYPVIEEVMDKLPQMNAKFIKGVVEFPNKSRLFITGADHKKKIQGFRGSKLRRCVIDEAQSFTDEILSDLIRSIIKPALADLGGVLSLTGTPSAHCQGIFYDITTGLKPGWDVHHWTAFDNPFTCTQWIRESKDFMEQECADESDPTYQREYLGIWKADTGSLMIKPFTLERPPSLFDLSNWFTVVGVDVGYNDETAFSVIGWQKDWPKAYVLKTFGYTQPSVTQIANTLLSLKAQYKPRRIVMDPAGGSKIMIQEYWDKHRISIDVAEKSNKAHYIEVLNDALIHKELLLNPSETDELQREMRSIVWNKERTRELEGKKCDHLDATLYAYREVLAYKQTIPVAPKPRTDEDLAREIFAHQAKKVREALQAKEGDSFFTDIRRFNS